MSLRVYYTLRKQSRKTGITVRITSTDLLRGHWKLHEWVGHTHTQWNKNDQWCLWHYCTSLVFFIHGSFLLKYDKLSSPHTHAYTVMFSLSGIPLHTDQLEKKDFLKSKWQFWWSISFQLYTQQEQHLKFGNCCLGFSKSH